MRIWGTHMGLYWLCMHVGKQACLLLLPQNWAHVEAVVAALNALPQQQHGVDIMRVREWGLAGWAAYYRHAAKCWVFKFELF
jgi:hypothetical protein